MQKTLLNHFKNNSQKEIIKLFHSLGMCEYNSCYSKKEFTNYQRFALITLYISEKKPLREFVKFLNLSDWRKILQLKKIPSKSTLNSWFSMFDLKRIKSLIENFKPTSKILAIDGTGLETEFKTNYFKKRCGLRTKSDFNKLDILIDIDSKYILDFEFMYKQRHDAFVAKRIFRRLKYSDSDILADKGYDSEELHQLCKNKKCRLISPKRDYGKKVWHNHYSLRNKLAKNFPYELYAKRNLVESVFSSLKRVELKILRMKRRDIEVTWKIICYNIRKSLLYFIFLLQNRMRILFLI